ncbi:methyltransferase domain-containing protein [Mesorhizobium xinjiangense]|uniref:methyltransferase domain-containing protein n=1 Tax=Mesorhizobium xinjiangense TaxID=2678685 RepID=UPI0012ED1127|nr:methyltransferase domain-containing protein [Mesorhizobium xinjiangense]
MQKQDLYALGYRAEEQVRLQAQARQLAEESRLLFDRIPLNAGSRVVEIGCGPHGCLDILSERVGGSGQVIGVERNEDAVSLARNMVRDRGLANVEIVHRDGRSTELEKNAFDLVTLRLVLVNVPKPEEILSEAVALVRPGGWIALHEADYLTFMCDPPSDAWARYLELFSDYCNRNGIDPNIGRRVPRLLRETAGIHDVGVQPIIHVYPLGHERRFIACEFADNICERLIAASMVTREEFAALRKELLDHVSRPETLVVSHLFFQVWGQKPGDQPGN